MTTGVLSIIALVFSFLLLSVTSTTTNHSDNWTIASTAIVVVATTEVITTVDYCGHRYNITSDIAIAIAQPPTAATSTAHC
jgi:hypothetical protein